MKLMQTDKSDAKGKKAANLKKKFKPVKKGKQKTQPKDSDESDDEGIRPLKETRISDEPVPRKSKWTNRQRVLVLCARGINHRDRHLMRDLRTLMPHHRAEPKMERWKTLQVVNEMSEMKHCNKVMLFEGRRKRDLYMWLANATVGPSVKFLVENIHTMGEMKLTGNCLRGSRPLLSFSEEFTKQPHLLLIKELLVQIFGVPNHHPKSQPFIDRVITFTYLDNRIWYRHFQILSEDGGLTEVGPRFVMNPIKIFSGSFGGDPIWENPVYQSPAKHRQMLRKAASEKYLQKTKKKVDHELNVPKDTHKLTPYGDIFKGGLEERVKEVLKQEKQRSKEERERAKIEKRQKLMKQRDEMRKLKLANAKQSTKKKLPTKKEKMQKEREESDAKEQRKALKKGAKVQKGGKKKFDGKRGVSA
ncbi:ribosome biogenesis protein BRX1 homolog [Anopheles stephensi]|uniref:Ribosome biogenesis protein BRX1 homolog n=1 Tax=Anopheles stephensi TaxID=30069 RepID=A0A182YNN0_ANOST|nr:ribosome biogenesis protein BRX1 homolog [Anopheles stephensi]